MKFYIEYYSFNTSARENGWCIIEFDFRSEITTESVLLKIDPLKYLKSVQVTNIVKL